MTSKPTAREMICRHCFHSVPMSWWRNIINICGCCTLHYVLEKEINQRMAEGEEKK